MITKTNTNKLNENTNLFLENIVTKPTEMSTFPEWKILYFHKGRFIYKITIDDVTIDIYKYDRSNDIPFEELIASYTNPKIAAQELNSIFSNNSAKTTVSTKSQIDSFKNFLDEHPYIEKNENTNIETFFNPVKDNTPTTLNTEKTIDALIASNGVVYSTDNNKTFTVSQMSAANIENKLNDKVELLWSIAAQILHETFDDYFKKTPTSDKLKINFSISETE